MVGTEAEVQFVWSWWVVRKTRYWAECRHVIMAGNNGSPEVTNETGAVGQAFFLDEAVPLSHTHNRRSVLLKHERRCGRRPLGRRFGGRSVDGRRPVRAAQQAAGWLWQRPEHRQVAVHPVGEGSGQLQCRLGTGQGRAAAVGRLCEGRSAFSWAALLPSPCDQVSPCAPAAACWGPSARSGWTGRAG